MAVDKEKLEKKIGEAIGLEIAQNAVEELSSRGLLPTKRAVKDKLERMKKQAGNHQAGMGVLVTKLIKLDGLESSKVRQAAQETEQKAIKIMKTYLGEDPDSQEALEFLVLQKQGK